LIPFWYWTGLGWRGDGGLGRYLVRSSCCGTGFGLTGNPSSFPFLFLFSSFCCFISNFNYALFCRTSLFECYWNSYKIFLNTIVVY
jgi:hypothetical protein